MTWPFENDTSAITKKLAKRNLKADKSRNILIIITIALATCLIMTTTLYFFASQRKSLNDAAGRYQAIINEVDNDTITKLVNDSRVQVGVSHLLGLRTHTGTTIAARTGRDYASVPCTISAMMYCMPMYLQDCNTGLCWHRKTRTSC